MALTDKLTDIADAIRNKTETTEPMTLDEMPSKIENIETKSEPNLQDKSIQLTENGTTTISADEGYDGLSKVDIELNVDPNIAWVIKDGIEQTGFTGGSTFAFVTGENQPGSMSQVEGAIYLNARIWSVYRLTFNNKINLKKFKKAYIECDYPNTSTPYAYQNAGLDVQLVNSNFSKPVKSGSTMSRTVIEVDLASDLEEDNLALSVYNSYDGSSNCGFNVYNFWLEGEDKPILQDKTIEITENGTQTITFDEGYDGLGNVEIIVNVANSGTSELLYTELEYIESLSTGGQYLLTDYKLNSNSRVVMKFSRNLSNAGASMFGVYNDNAPSIMFGFNSQNYHNHRLELYYGPSATVNLMGNSGQLRNNTDFIVDMNKNYLGLYDFDNTLLWEVTSTTESFTTPYTTPIMGAKVRSESVGNNGYSRLYYCQIYDGDNLIYDIIPVKNPSGVVCTYDKVSGTFMYNGGTGNFVAGPVVREVYK